MQFIDANLSPEARGFHPEKALLCRADANPFPFFVTQSIASTFYDNEAAIINRIEFIEQFRSRPVAFLLESWRLSLFPEEIRSFWSDHYVRYAPAVFVAGARIDLLPGDSVRFEVLVPGQYRWIPDSPADRNTVRIAGTTLEAGSDIFLGRKMYSVSPVADRTSGMLAIRMGEDPDPDSIPFFKPF
jgi:hypothetical protein